MHFFLLNLSVADSSHLNLTTFWNCFYALLSYIVMFISQRGIGLTTAKIFRVTPFAPFSNESSLKYKYNIRIALEYFDHN